MIEIPIDTLPQVSTVDTPNQGRVKINSNIDILRLAINEVSLEIPEVPELPDLVAENIEFSSTELAAVNVHDALHELNDAINTVPEFFAHNVLFDSEEFSADNVHEALEELFSLVDGITIPDLPEMTASNVTVEDVNEIFSSNNVEDTLVELSTRIEGRIEEVIRGSLYYQDDDRVTGINEPIVSNSLAGIASGENSIITDSDNSHVYGSASSISNSTASLVSGHNSSIEGGIGNSALGSGARIAGSTESVVVGLELENTSQQVINSNHSAMIASLHSVITGADKGLILGGAENRISGNGEYKTILGGQGNRVDTNSEFLTVSPSSRNTYARRSGEFVLSGFGEFDTIDENRTGTPDIQNVRGKASTIFLKATTTDNTPVSLKNCNLTEDLVLLDRTTSHIKVYLVASNFDANEQEAAYWELNFATDIRGGVARLLGLPIINELHKDVEDWDVDINLLEIEQSEEEEEGSNFGTHKIQILVTGENTKNIIWTARAEVTEVDF